MRKPGNVEITLSELKSFSVYLNELIENGSFYQLPFRERYRHIKHIKQLYSRLRGPVSDIKLNRILAAATVLAFVVPIKIGPGLTFTPAVSLLTGCSINTSEPAKTHVISQLVMSMAPTTLDSFNLTITGADMETIEESYAGDITEISIEVPAGEGRQFDLIAVVDPAEHSSIISYHGSSTSDLIAGETVEIDLNMEPVPVEPSFAAPVQNPFGISGLYDHAYPALVDLDDDGDLDLLVGDYAGSPIYNEVFRYFENIGTVDNPSFAPLVTDPFSLSAGDRQGAHAIADLDNDGDFDIMAGEYYYYAGNDGRFKYWENSGTASAPSFGVPNNNPFNLPNTTYYDFLTFGDLDADGDQDLLVDDDNYGADVLDYYENTGTPNTPDFPGSVGDPFGLTSIPSYAAPTFVDLNGDGDLDIVAGDQAGNLYYFENTGTAEAPAFAAPVQNPFGLMNTIGSTNAIPAFGDLDGDGDLDLIVGENATNLWYFENEAL